METLRQLKVPLIDVLATDSSRILQHVQNDKIITGRDYRNLNHPNHTDEKIVISLLDKVMSKGEQSCSAFLKLLETETVQETFPQLRELLTPTSTSNVQEPVQPGDKISEYKMSSKPRGFCVIINNIDFVSLKRRDGSERDEASLKEVFGWLGFTVEVFKNQTSQQMEDVLTKFSRKQHDGDCFVCCILSHGTEKGVCGTDATQSEDRGVVPRNAIFNWFTGTFCPSLVNKPKVFLIQACRGDQKQRAVQSDSCVEEENEQTEEETFESDAVQMSTLPADADFLVASSTVKGYLSYREKSGAWFIQALCEQMKKYCPMGEDMQSILIQVNEDVSKKTKTHKQIPMQKITLRKKLVFHVPK